MAGDIKTIPTEIIPVGQATTEKIEDVSAAIDAAEILRLKIDPEIQYLCKPLDDEARHLLEIDIKKNGCIDPIIYWEGHDTIVDGHNRYEICKRHGIRCECVGMSFEAKEDVMNYVIDHQLGRRNLSDLEKSYLRGKRYLTEKKASHRPKVSELHQNEGVSGETAEKIAKQSGVSSATIERDANLAVAIDKIRDAVGDDFVNKLRSGKTKLSKTGINELSKQPTEDIKVLAEYVQDGAKLSDAKELLESRKSPQSNPIAVSPALPKKDKSIEKVERHLEQAIEILEKMDAALHDDDLEELLATTQKIQDMLKAIGGKIPDLVRQDVNADPDIADVEIVAGPHELDFEDQKPYPGLPDGWGGYQNAIDAENENQEDMSVEV